MAFEGEEIRKDYLLKRYVIISPRRGKRPTEFIEKPLIVEERCFFCPGNEDLTPPEIGRIAGGPTGWKIRWFENKFPALRKETKPAPFTTANKYFTFAPNYGRHEIIVDTADHEKQFAQLSVQDISELLKVYCDRIAAFRTDPNIKFVGLFKNHGVRGGTSIIHSHTQLIAMPFVPTLIEAELEASRKFINCPYCEIVEIEKHSLRRCFENKEWVAFTPYASRYNYEVWLFPKKHVTSLEAHSLEDLASLLKLTLTKLSSLDVSYNFFFHQAPFGEDLHFHIEIAPRISIWGGFELCTDSVINTVSPEQAAAFYRGEA
ncbi:MAG: DUF4931 domain-containing protein [Candidatus Woesearchaeota archaeon]